VSVFSRRRTSWTRATKYSDLGQCSTDRIGDFSHEGASATIERNCYRSTIASGTGATEHDQGNSPLPSRFLGQMAVAKLSEIGDQTTRLGPIQLLQLF
jgi:hypothetical protein